MLISLKVKNFGPIGKKEFNFSTKPARGGTTAESKPYVIKTGFNKHNTPYVMSTIGIFGPNASGKTTVFQAINLLKNFILQKESNLEIPNTCFAFDEEMKSESSSIEIKFQKNNIQYMYSIEFKDKKITRELLKSKVNQNHSLWKKLIDRDHQKFDNKILSAVFASNQAGFNDFLSILKINDYNSHDSSKIQNLYARMKILESTQSNHLLLRTIHSLESDVLKDVTDFFKELTIFEGASLPYEYEFFKEISEKEHTKNRIISIFNATDFGLTDIKFTKEEEGKQELLPEKVQLHYGEIFSHLQELQKKHNDAEIKVTTIINDIYYEIFADGKVIKYTVRFKMESMTTNVSNWFYLHELSSGIRTMFSYANKLLNILDKGQVLLIDELERSLHPYLTNYIVDLFNNKDTNPNGAQLIFISHDISLLHKKSLQPEQVYFTQKNQYTLQSELYSLSEFSIKADRDGNYAEKYMNGKFGAIPTVYPERFAGGKEHG